MLANIEVQQWPVERLRAYRRTLRKHSSQHVDRIIRSYKEFGFKVPLLITSDGKIIDGELRREAALQAGLVMVPVILCDEWNDQQRRAFRMMANRSVDWAEWNFEEVAKEIAELQTLDFDTSLTGFDALEIDQMLAPLTNDIDEDAVPSVPETPVSRRGDLWLCGSHRVMRRFNRGIRGGAAHRLCGSGHHDH